MQGATDFHNLLTHSRAQEATDVFEYARAFDTAVDMFDGDPTTRERLSGGLLLSSEFATSGFLGGHFNDDSFQRESEKPQILKQVTALG
jgi:hypothetical protein